MNIWTWICLVLSFLAAFSIGSNDAANGLGTSYGTKAIPFWAIIINGAIAEFVGAFFCSDKVASTLVEGIILNFNQDDEKEYGEFTLGYSRRMMFSAILATFSFIILASFTGMPISGTHTIVSAIFGIGVTAGGKIDFFGPHGIFYILEGWILSPIISLVMAFFLFAMTTLLAMNTKTSYASRIHGTCVCVGIAAMFLTNILDQQFNRYFTLNLTPDEAKDAPKATAGHKTPCVKWNDLGHCAHTCGDDGKSRCQWDMIPYIFFLIGLGFIGGYLLARVVMVIFCLYKQVGRQSCGQKMNYLFKAFFMPWDTKFIEALTLNVGLEDYELDQNQRPLSGAKEGVELSDERLYGGLEKVHKMMNQIPETFQIDFNYLIDFKPDHCNFEKWAQKSLTLKAGGIVDGRLDIVNAHIGSVAEANRMSSEFLVGSATQSKVESGSSVSAGDRRSTMADAKYPGFNSTQIEVMTYQFKQAMIESQVFRCLMIFADFLVCLGHGSNDVANAISPLMVLMNEEDKPYWISFFVGGSGIAFGLLLFGQRVMQTIGEDVIELDYMKGYSAQFATSITVCVGTLIGLPLSTTHCIVGSLVGVHLAGTYLPFARRPYFRDLNEDDALRQTGQSNVPEKKKKDESSKMNVKTFVRILFWWALTIPAGFGVAAGLTAATLKAYDSGWPSHPTKKFI